MAAQSMNNNASSWNDVGGAISSSYNFGPTMTSDNGAKFRCAVTNSAGTVTSDAVTLLDNINLWLALFPRRQNKQDSGNSVKAYPNPSGNCDQHYDSSFFRLRHQDFSAPPDIWCASCTAADLFHGI